MVGSNGSGERLRVAQLRARDFKCIREVEIAPEGDIVAIAGSNGQGKTSILEALEATLRGGDETLVRRGAEHSELFVAVGGSAGGLAVSRRIGADGQQALAVTRDGQRLGAQQAKALLASIFGPHVFSPIRWVQLSGGDLKGRTERLRQQRDELLHALPLRLSEAELAEAVQQLADAAGELGPAVLQAFTEVHWDLDLDEQHGLVVAEALRKAYYDARTVANKEQEQSIAKLKAMPVPPAKVPAEDVGELARRERAAEEAWQRALGAQKAQAATRGRVQLLREQIARGEAELGQATEIDEAPILREGEAVSARIEQLRKELEQLAGRREELRQQLLEVRARNDALARARRNLEADRQELQRLQQDLGQAFDDPNQLRDRYNKAQEARQARQLSDQHGAAALEVEARAARARALDQLVELFREQLPQALLARASFPVPGLGLDGEQLTVNGIPIHRLSTSEQIRLGVRVAAALHPQAGFVCVDGVESLGAAGRRDLAAAAADFQVQLWTSEVSEHPEPGAIVMRAGEAVQT